MPLRMIQVLSDVRRSGWYTSILNAAMSYGVLDSETFTSDHSAEVFELKQSDLLIFFLLSVS